MAAFSKSSLLKLGQILLVITVVGAFFYPVLNWYFFEDDFPWLGYGAQLVDNPLKIFSPSPGKWIDPVSNLVFCINFRLFRFQPAGYYLASAFLHLVNTALVYKLVSLITSRKDLAFIGSLLFAAHFVHYVDYGAVTWVAAFVQLVSGLFYLLSCLSFVRHIQTGERRFYLWSAVALVMALLSKETSLSLLPMLFLCQVILYPGDITQRGHFWKRFVPLTAIFVTYLVYEFSFQMYEGNIGEGLYGLGWHVLLNIKHLFYLLIPNVQSPPVMNYLSRAFSPTLAQTALQVLDLLSWSVIAVGVILTLKGHRHTRFFTLWVFIAFAPFLGFGGGGPRPTRYLYLPSVGFTVLMGMLLLYLRDKAKNLRVAAVLLPLLIAGILLYNLVPTRIWERQMAINSQEKRALIAQTGEILASMESVPDRIMVVGLPEKYSDVVWAMNLFYGSQTTFAWAEESFERNHNGNGLYLLYQDGAILAMGVNTGEP